MGMYDTINDEQVKFFVRTHNILSEDGEVLLDWAGGALEYFSINSVVPYRTHFYNLGKNFNIVDYYPEEHPDVVIHLIRDGKNIGFKYLINLKDEDLCFDTYEYNGRKFKEVSIEIIKDRLSCIEKINNAKLESSSVFSKMLSYKRKKDEKSQEEYKKLKALLDTLSEKEEKEFYGPIKEHVNKYLGHHFMSYQNENYSLLGTVVDSLYDYKDNKADKFFISDSRLNIIAYTEKMEEILQSINLNDYFKKFDFDESDKDDFLKQIEYARKLYKEMRSLKVSKNDINEEYLLKDIQNGRYQKAYTKYNVIPYEGFDINNWCEINTDNIK